MQKDLENLKQNICTFPETNKISESEWSDFAQNTTVALMAGGLGSRLKTVTDAQNVHKTSLRLPDGETMIEKTIKMYRDAGITDFLALVYHKAESIINVLGDGSRLGVTIHYGYDPEPPAGKAGALKNALALGNIDKNRNLIIHNPDDMVVNYDGSFPKDIVEGHLMGVSLGNIATVVVVEETPYQYTGMKVTNGEVSNITMYPNIPIPTHIGVTIFSPKVYEYFEKYFDLTKKEDFEKVLFPILSSEGKLFATKIPSDCWVAVNNPKALNQLLKALNLEEMN